MFTDRKPDFSHPDRLLLTAAVMICGTSETLLKKGLGNVILAFLSPWL